MHVRYLNATEAFECLPGVIMDNGDPKETRNGMAYSMGEPMVVSIDNPEDRLILNDKRDIHYPAVLAETLWVLAGRNDVSYLDKYLKNLRNYSDDGYTWRGAYGYRWRHHFGKDQIETAINRLHNYPNDRRTIISMWDASMDLNNENHWKDLPCNMLIKLQVRKGMLDMTVFNRSNDLVWGALNVNIFQFTLLQEYIAARLCIPVGYYNLVSDDLHIYEETAHKIQGSVPKETPISSMLFDCPEEFMRELEKWMKEHDNYFLIEDTYENSILNEAKHIINAYRIFKRDKKVGMALEYLQDYETTALIYAMKDWLSRRNK